MLPGRGFHRIRFLPFLLALGCVFTGCSSSDLRLGGAGILVGRIFVIGNEPFTKVGLEAETGEMYVLECTPDLQTVLRRKQGATMKIHYEMSERVPEGLAVKVIRAEEVAVPGRPVNN